MEIMSRIVVYIIMFFAVVGCLASIIRPGSELGEKFLEGIRSIGDIFIPVAGIMAALPLLSRLVGGLIGPLFQALGADPAVAATTFLAADMGGYQLAQALSQSLEGWMFATTVGFMAGATLVFTIPVALNMIDDKFLKPFSIGIMIGFITIPIGVLISNLLMLASNPAVRTAITSDSAATTQILRLTVPFVLINVFPLLLICIILVLGLKYIPEGMIKGFKYFAIVIDAFTKIVLVIVMVEFFTGLPQQLLGFWPFEPIVADAADINRALEVAGYIGLMLAGAFPMVYIIQTKLKKPMDRLGKRIGLSANVASGILASSANAIAAFAMIDDSMTSKEIIAIVAFSVCGAFAIGDHLAFIANFQPNLIVSIVIGKLIAGFLAVFIALKIGDRITFAKE